MNLLGVYRFYNFNIALNRTMVTQSLKVSYPTIMELSFGYLFYYRVSYDATVSMLHRQAESRIISQIDKFLKFVISFASLTKSMI